MKIIYLSKNMSNYKGAFYQHDMMEEISKCQDVTFYGPGFEGFDSNEKIKKTIHRLGGADLIIVGHAWLIDTPNISVDPYPKLSLEDCSVPKVIILNKEYANLESKLKWISKKNFSFGFSHHYDIELYKKKTKVPFKFIPLAFNENLFKKTNQIYKDIDFAFCGLLKNNLSNTGQSEARIIAMKKLFHCLGDIPIMKKDKYKKYNLFWNAIPRNLFMRQSAILLNKYRFLNNEEYVNLQFRSRAFLNTLSPIGLVSTRFFENMASKSLVFCEKSENVKRIFPSECYITFESNFSDFDEKLELAISDSFERSKIIKMAFDLAYAEHTWKIRVKKMMEVLYSI